MRRARATACALLCCALAAPAAADPGEIRRIDVGEREPLAFILVAPTGEISNSSRSEVYAIVSDILLEKTSYRLRELDNTAAVEKCRGNVGCLVLEVRPDFDPERPDVPRGKGRAPRWLVLLSLKTIAPGEDSATAILVDTQEAIARYRAEREEFEELVFQHALRAQPEALIWHDPGEVAPSLEKLFLRDFPESFTQGTVPLGTLEISTEHEGVQIDLDGVAIGSTAAGRTRIEGLAEGERQLVFTHTGFETLSKTIPITRGAEAKLDLILVSRGSQVHQTARDVIFWSGLGAVAAGAALTVASVVKSATADTSRICLAGSSAAQCGDYDRFVRFSDPSSTGESGGLMMAPLGVSVTVAGGLWTLGTFIDEELAPWLALGVGIVAGAGTYLVAVATESDDPYARR